jgi:hypothetical protein
MKYQIWATSKEGDGYVQDLGKVEDPTDILIRVGMFSDDVIITVEEDFEEEN